MELVPEVDNAPIISIVVLARESEPLNKCLLAIRRQASPTPWPHEVIVIAEGVSARGETALRPQDRLIRLRTGIGTAPSLNLAARHAKGKHLAFLMGGSIVHPTWMHNLIDTMESTEDIGIVGSALRGPEPAEIDEPAYNTFLREMDFVSTNGLLIRAKTFAEVGGFDERYRPWGYEDRDICLAVRRQGLRVVCNARSVVACESNQIASIDRDLAQFVQMRNEEAFRAKWGIPIASDAPPKRRLRPSAEELEMVRSAGLAVASPAHKTADSVSVEALQNERRRADEAEAMLDATDQLTVALELQVIELRERVVDLQSAMDRFHARDVHCVF